MMVSGRPPVEPTSRFSDVLDSTVDDSTVEDGESDFC